MIVLYVNWLLLCVTNILRYHILAMRRIWSPWWLLHTESWMNLTLLWAKTGLNIPSEWNTISWLMELLLLISNKQYWLVQWELKLTRLYEILSLLTIPVTSYSSNLLRSWRSISVHRHPKSYRDLNSIYEQGNQANLWPITLQSYKHYPIIVILAILSS